MSAIGAPDVLPFHRPPALSILSFSIFIRFPRPFPPCLRCSWRFMSSSESSNPEGIPSNIPTSEGPCDSPAVRNLSVMRLPPSFFLRADLSKKKRPRLPYFSQTRFQDFWPLDREASEVH